MAKKRQCDEDPVQRAVDISKLGYKFEHLYFQEIFNKHDLHCGHLVVVEKVDDKEARAYMVLPVELERLPFARGMMVALEDMRSLSQDRRAANGAMLTLMELFDQAKNAEPTSPLAGPLGYEIRRKSSGEL